MFPSLFEKKESNAIFIPIEIKLLNDRICYISIGRYTTAKDLCLAIKDEIGIKSWLDFKLFLCFSEEDETLIDDEEFMYQVLDWKQEVFEQEKKKGGCQGFTRLFLFTFQYCF